MDSSVVCMVICSVVVRWFFCVCGCGCFMGTDGWVCCCCLCWWAVMGIPIGMGLLLWACLVVLVSKVRCFECVLACVCYAVGMPFALSFLIVDLDWSGSVVLGLSCRVSKYSWLI